MAHIEFIEDYNGEQQAYDFIFEEIAEKAIQDPNYREISHLVLQALQRMKNRGLMPEEEIFFGTRTDDAVYSIRPLMKKVVEPYGPYEMFSLRINYKRVFAFRAVFFVRYPEPEKEETFFITRALLKTTDHSEEFNQAVRDTQRIIHDYEKKIRREEELKQKKEEENR